MAGDKKAKEKDDPSAGPSRGRQEGDEESATTAGITDPAKLAAIREERRLIEEAQARIAAITGGKMSRAGASSTVSKGSATVTISRSFHESTTAAFTPTTVLDPVTGLLQVVQEPKPGVFSLGQGRGAPGLLESLPAALQSPLPGEHGDDQEEGGEEDDDVLEIIEPAAKAPGARTRAAAAAEAAASEGKKDITKKKVTTEKKEADPGLPPLQPTGKTRLLLREANSDTRFELFIDGPHDYEEGDEILLRHKDGTGTPVVVEIVEDNAVVGPNAHIGAVGPVATEEEMARAKKRLVSGQPPTEEETEKEKEKEKDRGEKEKGRKSGEPKALGKKPMTKKQPLPDVGAHGSLEADPYEEADLAEAKRGLDVESEVEMEPATLRQMWEWTDEKVAKARKLAQDVANMGDNEKITTRAQMKIRELEAYLHSRVGTKPRDPPELTQAEVNIEEETVSGKEPGRELITRAVGYSRVAAKTGLANQRGITVLLDKLDLHTRVHVITLEILNDLRRVMTKYDRPVHKEELMSNPDLNPYLSGYVPFNNQTAVKEFVDQPERTYALQRWILGKLSWDVNTFVSRMVDLVCTPEYRIRFSFPGKQTMAHLIYIPEKFATLLFGVAEQAAADQGFHNPDKIRDQLRVAFQACNVKRKNRPEEDPSKKGKKRRRRTYGDEEPWSTDSESEQSQLRLHDDFEHTLVEYTSYLELTKDEDCTARSGTDDKSLDGK